MARFWDTSALVPLLVEHPHSVGARDLARGDREIVVFQFTPTEVVSAFTKSARLDRWSDDQLGEALDRLDSLGKRWSVVRALDERGIDELVARARGLMLKHPISSSDALQLVAAMTAFDPPHRHGFVVADRGLAVAALAEGFTVFKPDAPKRGGRGRK